MPLIRLLLLWGLLATGAVAQDATLDQAQRAMASGDFAAAANLAAQAVRQNPDNAAALYLLGTAQARQRQYDAAIQTLSTLLQLQPNSPDVLDRRGDAYLKSGKYTQALADFDAVLKLRPDLAPQHWRRGIALYYAGKYAEGVKQFEIHQTANPQDVENAAWHYLCNIHVAGKEQARAKLIDVTRDPRVPMAQIQKLFAGKLPPDAVLAAAEKIPADSDAGQQARCYAHLYVGLWHEATGHADLAKKHLTTAAKDYPLPDHYMWEIAAMHATKLSKSND